MRDVLHFAVLFEVLVTLAEMLVLKEYLAGFLIERNALIKTVAESEAWRRFVPEGT